MSAPVSEQDEARSFRLRLPATPSSLAVLRRLLRDWLKGHYLPPADIFDIVLACSEALTLVIEDPPRRTALVIEVGAELDDGRLVIMTRDYGLWQESHALDCDEPLGLSLIRALMDSVELERHPDGQTVTLVRNVQMGSGRRNALLI
jgi:anti-sigma regulatory factor (Ser/Thr protein kinase)